MKRKQKVALIASEKQLVEERAKGTRYVIAGSRLAPAALITSVEKTDNFGFERRDYVTQPDVFTSYKFGISLFWGNKLRVRVLKSLSRQFDAKEEVCLSHDLVNNWYRKKRKSKGKTGVFCCYKDDRDTAQVQLFIFDGGHLEAFEERKLSLALIENDLAELIDTTDTKYALSGEKIVAGNAITTSAFLEGKGVEMVGEAPFSTVNPKVPVELERESRFGDLVKASVLAGIGGLVFFATDSVQHIRFEQSQERYSQSIVGIEDVIKNGASSIELLQSRQYFMEEVTENGSASSHITRLNNILASVMGVREAIPSSKAVLKSLRYSKTTSLQASDNRQFDFIATVQVNLPRNLPVSDRLQSVTSIIGEVLAVDISSVSRPVVTSSNGTVTYQVGGKFNS